MKYVNAKDVLPPEILLEVQKYSCGALIYVPRKDGEKVNWGERSGARTQTFVRNKNIVDAYKSGASVFELMGQYCLSESSIRKIIYTKRLDA